MATAQLQVSVNGGAPQTGGIDVPSGATLQFSGVSTVGWTQQRYEIVDYPEGWATPAGWTLGADGTIYSTAVTPSLITLPTNTSLWGAWCPQLKVNEQVASTKDLALGLLDTATRVTMLSPQGRRDLGALEGGQFCTSTTLIKQWCRTIQRNLRTEESLQSAIALASNFNSAASTAAQSTNLSIAVGASDVVLVEFGGNWSVASGTSGAKLALSVPPSATLEGAAHGEFATGLSTYTSAQITASGTLVGPFNTVAGTSEGVWGSCRVKMNGTAGNIVLQVAPAAAVALTLKAGFWMRARMVVEV